MSLPEAGFPLAAAVSPRLHLIETVDSTNAKLLHDAAAAPQDASVSGGARVRQVLFQAGPLIALVLVSFGLIAVAQALFPLWMHHPATAALRVHLANGLYINALFDRMIGGFRIARPN